MAGGYPGTTVDPYRSGRVWREGTPATGTGDTIDSAISNDGELIKAVAEGDGDALAVLYDRHGTAVFSLCLRMLRDADDAEELLEHVFWQLWRRADQFDPTRGSALAYLLTLTRSRAIDRLRARERRVRRRSARRSSCPSSRASSTRRSPPGSEIRSGRSRPASGTGCCACATRFAMRRGGPGDELQRKARADLPPRGRCAGGRRAHRARGPPRNRLPALQRGAGRGARAARRSRAVPGARRASHAGARAAARAGAGAGLA